MASAPGSRPRLAYTTPRGRMYVGQAEDALSSSALARSRCRVQLVFTSPPFPLCREKAYGNLRGDDFEVVQLGWR